MPIFTEVVGYGQKISDSDDEDETKSQDSWEDDDVDRSEMVGVEGMIF